MTHQTIPRGRYRISHVVESRARHSRSTRHSSAVTIRGNLWDRSRMKLVSQKGMKSSFSSWRCDEALLILSWRWCLAKCDTRIKISVSPVPFIRANPPTHHGDRVSKRIARVSRGVPKTTDDRRQHESSRNRGMEATAQRIRGDTRDLSATRRAEVEEKEGWGGKAAASLLRYGKV